jgi:ubiquitin-conjugating enzyme E2 S
MRIFSTLSFPSTPKTNYSLQQHLTPTTFTCCTYNNIIQQAEVDGPQETPYEGKSFWLRFTFGVEFPATPPTAHFLTKVYHPNICPTTGAVCVNTLQRDWQSSHTLKHCLAVIRCLLLQPFPDSALNEDAGKLFMESYDEYFQRARLHADVHGRPGTAPPAAAMMMTTNTDPRVLASRNQSSSSSFLSSTMSSNNSNTTSNTLPAADKKKMMMTKKKSLKRL